MEKLVQRRIYKIDVYMDSKRQDAGIKFLK